MPPQPAEASRLAAAAGLALVLVVVIVSAAIRLQGASVALRAVHRSAASLEVVVVLWLAWLAWRARAGRPSLFRGALLALAISAFLSIVGIVFGPTPPPSAAAANLLGGLALAAVFAWILGDSGPFPWWLGALLTAQLGLGAWLAIVDRWTMALPAHAMAGLALAALLAWAGLSRVRGRAGAALFALALIVPVAGFTALQYERSTLAALAHAAVAALLLAGAAYACARNA